LYANLRAKGLRNNSWFTQNHRDNCTYHFWLLREKLQEIGIEINSPDVNEGRDIAFEIHIDIQDNYSARHMYLFIWETFFVHPRNGLFLQKKKLYNKIFTWNDSLVNNYGLTKFYLPAHLDCKPFAFGWVSREKLCCIIASNKATKIKSSLELYTKRVDIIRWFEANAHSEFDLFGFGWNNPVRTNGFLGLVEFILKKGIYTLLRYKPFKSYRGTILNKRNVLERYKFSICYENVSGLEGYVTEKIFDCFMSGTIPVYWGASNISKYVPEECFIDRRLFRDNESLYAFLSSMSELEYIKYQKSIAAFLNSENISQFKAEKFVSLVLNQVVSDFSN
jgi:hypothetical protein